MCCNFHYKFCLKDLSTLIRMKRDITIQLHTQSDNYIMRLIFFVQDGSAIYDAMHAIHVPKLHL